MIRGHLKILSFSKKKLVNLGVALVLSYFVFHSIYGNRGILSYFTLKAELENSYHKLDTLRNERLEIENRTKLLRPDSLDIDMLDERVRNMLGLTEEKEKVFQPEMDSNTK